MGGGIDGRLGIPSTVSPHQSSDLEKTQAVLRQTYTAAEKFRRELEFLQKGGNPLDLKTRSSAPVSVQSTSLTDQHPEQFVTSEAKGSFAVTASPHGDSVGSSGRLGDPSVCEPNSADNLMLFDGDNKFREVERRSVCPPTNNIIPLERYSQLDSCQNARESGDSVALELPKKSYKRRIRSRPNRDGARSSSSDAALSRASKSFSPFHHASRDVNGLAVAANQERNGLLSFNSKLKGSNANVIIKNVVSNSLSDMELDGVLAVETTLGRLPGPSSDASDANASRNNLRNHHDLPSKSDSQESPPDMAFVEPESLEDAQRAKNSPFLVQTNGVGTTEGQRISMPHDGNRRAAISTKGLDSESSCTQTGQSLDVNIENELPTSPRNINCNGTMEQNLASNEVPGKDGNNLVKEKEGKILNIANNKFDSCHGSHNGDGFVLKEEEGLKGCECAWQNELKNPVLAKGVKPDGSTALKTERKSSDVLGSNSFPQSVRAGRPQGASAISFLESTLSVRGPTDAAEQSACSQNNLNLATKEHEESILKEARIIEAKRKRIAELSVSTLPLQNCQYSKWDFVLEEMSWLANDFAQEHLWKVTAAAQISRQVAFASQIRYRQQNSSWKQKEVAQTLGRAVMEFWHKIQVKCKELELQCLKKDSKQGLHGYVMRFLEYNSSHAQYSAAQVSPPPDMIRDVGIIDIAWGDNLTEENLFYTVAPGAIEVYRKSIESHLLQCERTLSSTQDVDISGYDAVADNAFDDDGRETRALPGALEGSKASKATKKRRKNFKFYTARSYGMGADFPFVRSFENNIGSQPSVLSGKRPGSSLNVSIPTKHVRTASRQRVLGPFNAGVSGYIEAPNRTDASSGDTNSFQDEQITLHGGAEVPNNMEAESVGEYEKQLQFDTVEMSDRPRKKKKAKHSGSSFDHRWQLDSNFQKDQKDHSKRRLDAHELDSKGINVSSRMHNMANPKKFMELLVRDRGRKSKTHKISPGQPGSGSPWSLFEDQSLVVLVHDMGPNWELISDAINSTLQSKRIFRSSKECKERHKMLMDRNTGDEPDTAEDSEPSQSYPSTLPGIPEGSARQLFQRLQGPMEEDTLKSHFEKIIMIGQKQYYKRTQNDNQDAKQQQPHSSHTLSLSQVSPNNLNGRPVLTPLELCDAIASTPDVPTVVHQGSHSGGLPVPDQANGASMLPGSSSSSSVPGSSSVVQPNPSVREVRYGIPRTGSLPKDDQQRVQQYNQMLSARNFQHSNLTPASHSGTDRGVRMLPVGNGNGVMSGLNRSMPMAGPGFHGVASPSMLNAANMHPRPGPGQGSSMLRPRDAVHLMKPHQNSDQLRQVLPADHQLQQVSQGVPPFSSGTSSSFPNQTPKPPVQSPNLLASNFHNRNNLERPPNTAINISRPPLGIRFLNNRQLQQRAPQQQQFTTSNAMMPHAQPPKSHLPISSPQNSTQIQSQSSPSVSHSPIRTPSMASIPQNGQKHPLLPLHGLARHPYQIPNQQRHRQMQPFQQPGRPHTQTHSSLSQPHQQKTYSGQIQKPSLSSDNNNHQNHHQPHQKFVNLSQTTAAQKTVNNRLISSTEPSKSMLQARETAQTEQSMPQAPSSDATESFYGSSVNHKISSTGGSSKHSGPAVNQVMVLRQAEPDSLASPVALDVGVQWQQLPSS